MVNLDIQTLPTNVRLNEIFIVLKISLLVTLIWRNSLKMIHIV